MPSVTYKVSVQARIALPFQVFTKGFFYVIQDYSQNSLPRQHVTQLLVSKRLREILFHSAYLISKTFVNI